MNSLGHFHLIHEDREWEKTVSKMHVIEWYVVNSLTIGSTEWAGTTHPVVQPRKSLALIVSHKSGRVCGEHVQSSSGLWPSFLNFKFQNNLVSSLVRKC